MAVQRFSHIAIRVSDLERARTFYREALECREVSQLEIQGGPTAQVLGIDDLKLRALFLERDGTHIELQQLDLPLTEEKALWSRLGLGHIAFRVDDLEAVTARVQQLGGEVLEASRMRHAQGGAQVVFVADPDGTRIELIQSAGDPSVPPGDPIAAEA